MKYLGIDYGSKKIGLALSDDAGTMGFPHSIIPNTAKAGDHICAVVAKEDVRALVIGKSIDYSGNENPVAKSAHALGSHISERCGVPVFYESEVLTSAEARRAPGKEEKSRSPRSKTPVDDSAAALILTSYLTKKQNYE
jgi:putative holliday junction resolvase